MLKRDSFVRFISIHDMSTPIRTDYEALVGLLDSKIDLLLRKYHTRLIPYLCIHVYNKSMDMWDTNFKKNPAMALTEV